MRGWLPAEGCVQGASVRGWWVGGVSGACAQNAALVCGVRRGEPITTTLYYYYYSLLLLLLYYYYSLLLLLSTTTTLYYYSLSI
jgi:hypothetical protein